MKQIFDIEFQRETGNFKSVIAILKKSHPFPKEDILSEVEKKRAMELTHEKKKNGFIIGRLAAKYAVNQLLERNLPLPEISIDQGVFGFPLLNCPDTSVSISHSSDLAFAMAYPSKHPLGIDVEELNRSNEAILKQLTDLEKKLLNQHALRPTHFWSAKEALSKAIKTGLTTPLHILEINKVVKEPTNVTFSFTHFNQYKASCFLLNNHVFSICYPKKSKLHLISIEPFTPKD